MARKFGRARRALGPSSPLAVVNLYIVTLHLDDLDGLDDLDEKKFSSTSSRWRHMIEIVQTLLITASSRSSEKSSAPLSIYCYKQPVKIQSNNVKWRQMEKEMLLISKMGTLNCGPERASWDWHLGILKSSCKFNHSWNSPRTVELQHRVTKWWNAQFKYWDGQILIDGLGSCQH